MHLKMYKKREMVGWVNMHKKLPHINSSIFPIQCSAKLHIFLQHKLCHCWGQCFSKKKEKGREFKFLAGIENNKKKKSKFPETKHFSRVLKLTIQKRLRLIYTPNSIKKMSKAKNNILWFNPLYNKGIKTHTQTLPSIKHSPQDIQQ